ncbi:AAA family ATPase, partial [Candidatus Saccharibacteria bacterium]|nr:AAA family ATPase [Candidatus Saccharibacteria bacterium]
MENSKPNLYLMLGYPGAGKTTAAKIISELTGAVHIWADHERRQMHDSDNYVQVERTAEFNIKLYDSLNKRSVELLKQGKSVVYDAAFNHLKDRL